MITAHIIGSKIKGLRKQVNYTTSKLAKESYVAQSYLSDIENGKSVPTIETVEKILKVLNISLTDFFASIENTHVSEPLTPEIKALVDAAMKHSPEKIELLAKFLDTDK